MLGKGAALLGAQNCASADEGAMTGEYSPTMLLSVGAKFVILGHSERRAMGETSEEVAVKAARALGHNLQVIICVGEKERDAESGFYREVKEQLEASLRGVPTKYGRRVVVAYEPIWAIGEKAKRAATTEDFREMRVLLRNVLVDHFGRSAGFAVPILYGGSVDEKNAEGFLRQGEADGLLVGRASLDPARFGAILRIASAIH
jgi:triosephosphate isomerase